MIRIYIAVPSMLAFLDWCCGTASITERLKVWSITYEHAAGRLNCGPILRSESSSSGSISWRQKATQNKDEDGNANATEQPFLVIIKPLEHLVNYESNLNSPFFTLPTSFNIILQEVSHKGVVGALQSGYEQKPV